jgi:hypothetical protein
VIIRPAESEEIPSLQWKLSQREAEGYEQFPLAQAIVFVAEDFDGLLAGMVCLRLRNSPISMAPMWHVEPLILFRDFLLHSPRQAQRKATYMLAKAAEAYVMDPERNTTGVRAFFVFIENKNKPMHGLARHIGWKTVKGKLYAKEATHGRRQ